MPSVRPFAAGDVDAVADMFQRLLRKSRLPASADLRAYLRALFLDFCKHDPDICSRVHVRDDGTVSGFLGVLPFDMRFGDRSVRAAACGTFVSDTRESDPFAGARLLRDVLSGPQDLSFTETSNDISTSMWRSMRATPLAPYSLEWLRVLKPSAFLLAAAAPRLPGLKLLAPLARGADRFVTRRGGQQAWIHYSPAAGRADALVDTEAENDEFAGLCLEFAGRFALRPDWDQTTLETMLGHAERKALHGERVQRVVRTRAGKPVGLYLYYGDRGGIGRTVQVMAAAGHEAIVLDRLLRSASERGLAAIRGRTQPNLLQAMIGSKFAFLQTSATLVHARDPELLQAAVNGQAFLNGLAGEGWTRLIGDRFG
ncbi:hypothetical protein KYK29_09515 [Shinella daejeonensis]|nr:hypothetical protein [Shinella daejeonensis]